MSGVVNHRVRARKLPLGWVIQRCIGLNDAVFERGRGDDHLEYRTGRVQITGDRSVLQRVIRCLEQLVVVLNDLVIVVHRQPVRVEGRFGDHRQDRAGFGIERDDRALHLTQCIPCRLLRSRID